MIIIMIISLMPLILTKNMLLFMSIFVGELIMSFAIYFRIYYYHGLRELVIGPS